MMKISRDVILDLLPVYLANEASDDTRALVEQFLADDPALAKLVEQSNQERWGGEIPFPLNKEQEMISFEKTKQLLSQQKLFLALAIATTLFFIAFNIVSASVEWLGTNSPQLGFVIFIVAGIFWTAFLNVAHILNRKD
ncbi:hypothetical protein MNBD_CHLOROFLEXI01-4909 [hydrothermal vent metagenome]|uniref:Zinc-finger domain-containing protein n=1 Tax=hydrothermal vent metagenome TaxID=652676 RepID=A0A3B0VM24_9ZZZZ